MNKYFNLKNIDLKVIWLVLLLLNFKVGDLYIVNFLTLLMSLLIILRKNRFNIFFIISSLTIFLLAVFGFSRGLYIVDPLKYLFNFFQIFIYFTYFKIRLNKTKNSIDEFVSFIIFSLILYLPLAFFEFIYGNVLWFNSRNYDIFLPRVNLGFGDSNSLAGFLILALSFSSRNKLLLFLNILVGFITFSRSYIVSLPFFLFFYKNFKIKFILYFVILSPVIYYLFQYLNFLDINFAVDRLFNSGLEENNPRLIEWYNSLSAISFLPNWSIFNSTADPHNSYLLAIQLVGPVGAFIMFLMLKGLISPLFYSFSNRDSVSILSAIFAFFIFCFFNSELFSVRNTCAMGIIISIYYQLNFSYYYSKNN